MHVSQGDVRWLSAAAGCQPICGARDDGMVVRSGKDQDGRALQVPGMVPMTLDTRRLQGQVRADPQANDDDVLRRKLVTSALDVIRFQPGEKSASTRIEQAGSALRCCLEALVALTSKGSRYPFVSQHTPIIQSSAPHHLAAAAFAQLPGAGRTGQELSSAVEFSSNPNLRSIRIDPCPSRRKQCRLPHLK